MERLTPEEIIKERERVRADVSAAKAKVKDAIDSRFWSYTREYELGKLDTAKKILEEVERDITPVVLNPGEPIAPVTPSKIIEAVASYYRLTIPTLTGRDRDERRVLARQVAMYLIRQETNLTLAQVGKEIGGRTPATIHCAYGKIAHHLTTAGVLRGEGRSIQEDLLERFVIKRREAGV